MSSSQNMIPRFKNEIMSAVEAVRSAEKTISIGSICQQLTPVIVENYNDISFFTYKAVWIKRIKSTLEETGTVFSSSKVNFETIFCLIKDKALGIEADYNLRANNCFTAGIHPKPIPTSTSTSTSISTPSTTNSNKQVKLDDIDKTKISNMYNALKKENMWKLTTGTYVEKQMESFALTCKFEHPCHSLIFDSGDKCWDAYFTEEELYEIKSFQLKKFPLLPSDLKDYLQSLLENNSLDLDNLYSKVNELSLHPVNNSTREWAQSTVLYTIKLFMCQYIPLTDQSEADIIRRVWALLDTVFDYSVVTCRSGEKSSSASSDGRNQGRTIAGVNPMARKICGRKVDMVFRSTSTELGCMECGRSDGVSSTKELSDGYIKLPIVLKDMFLALCSIVPSIVNDLTIPGLIIMNTKLTIVTMDSPCGYVCRLNRVKPTYFPTLPSEIITRLVPILKQVYSVRLLMEQNMKLLSSVPVSLDDEITFEVKSDLNIPPSFVSAKKSCQKRKNEEMS